MVFPKPSSKTIQPRVILCNNTSRDDTQLLFKMLKCSKPDHPAQGDTVQWNHQQCSIMQSPWPNCSTMFPDTGVQLQWNHKECSAMIIRNVQAGKEHLRCCRVKCNKGSANVDVKPSLTSSPSTPTSLSLRSQNCWSCQRSSLTLLTRLV